MHVPKQEYSLLRTSDSLLSTAHRQPQRLGFFRLGVARFFPLVQQLLAGRASFFPLKPVGKPAHEPGFLWERCVPVDVVPGRLRD
jgi:hypothetical protein